MMKKSIKRKSKKVSLPPGTLVHIGEKKVDRVRITIINYDEKEFEEREAKTIEECFPFKDKPTVTWINMEGLNTLELIIRNRKSGGKINE